MTATGKTPFEKYLANLCKNSFLSLWSYPNVYNNKGIGKFQKIGKELSDLLVVFGNDVIIFSDKSCEFKQTNNLVIDWNRWYRKAIIKSMDQLYGAERWIREFPDRIFLDSKAQIPFPIHLPSPEKIRVHKVAVALGAKVECIKYFGGGSGSLRISSDLEPIINSEEEILKAFTIGWHDPIKGFVHIFDDVTLDIILQELDTIADFIEYLKKKEELFTKKIVLSGGEEELLAFYMQNIDEKGNRGFDIQGENHDGLYVDEGSWKAFIASEHYSQKKDADKVSYAWDKLIEHFNEAYISKKFTGEIKIEDYENTIRKCASLNRFERRIAGNRLINIFQSCSTDKPRFSAIYLNSKPDIVFAFVLFPKPASSNMADYQLARRNALDAYSNVLKLKFPKLDYVVALGSEPPKPGYVSTEDLFYRNFQNWNEEDDKIAQQDQKMLGLKMEEITFSEKEYPDNRKSF